MNRRSFLRLAGLSAAAMALDPERGLWVPGQKTYFDFGRYRGFTIRVGDIITFDGVYVVNPEGAEAEPRTLQQFVITERCTEVRPGDTGLIRNRHQHFRDRRHRPLEDGAVIFRLGEDDRGRPLLPAAFLPHA